MRVFYSACCSLLLTALASAQFAQYDAGVGGVAPSPTSQGWTLAGNTGGVHLNSINPDGQSGHNAWEISDGSPTGWATYERMGALPTSWECEITMRVVAGDSPFDVFLQIQNGETFHHEDWTFGFQIVGSDVWLTSNGPGSASFLCPNAAGSVHTYSFRRLAGILGASAFGVQVAFDGVVLGVHEAFLGTPWGRGVRFGTGRYSGNTTGSMRIHSVVLRDLSGVQGSTIVGCAQVPNSTGSLGSLYAFGSTSVTGPGLSLGSQNLPTNALGYYLIAFGTDSAFPIGSQGHLCLSPLSIARINLPHQVRFSGPGGEFFLELPINEFPTGSLSPGTAYLQGWYRDMNPTPTSNFTETLAISFQ